VCSGLGAAGNSGADGSPAGREGESGSGITSGIIKSDGKGRMQDDAFARVVEAGGRIHAPAADWIATGRES
ncbi:MAG TPA: hypothetical protein VLC97_03905, partial [Rhodanobacteraceae bacterium]|nr:hypothetical protein [Rhodanobacteraceae bacterium]